MAERDTTAAIRAMIDQHLETAAPYGRSTADTIVEQLRTTDPQLYRAWLDGHAEQLMWDTIRSIVRSGRAHNRHAHSRSQFSEMLDQHTADPTAGVLGGWLQTRWSVDGSYRRLGELRAPQLRTVAKQYRDTQRICGFHAMFFEALAAKLGDRPVEQVYTDQQLHDMYLSVGGEQ
jgi:hypothetical protein